MLMSARRVKLIPVKKSFKCSIWPQFKKWVHHSTSEVVETISLVTEEAVSLPFSRPSNPSNQAQDRTSKLNLRNMGSARSGSSRIWQSNRRSPLRQRLKSFKAESNKSTKEMRRSHKSCKCCYIWSVHLYLDLVLTPSTKYHMGCIWPPKNLSLPIYQSTIFMEYSLYHRVYLRA